jgi:hypothetical protein
MDEAREDESQSLGCESYEIPARSAARDIQ